MDVGDEEKSPSTCVNTAVVHGSLWDVLPDEVIDLILRHRAAQTIRQTFLRTMHFRHARRAVWPEVRARLGRLSVSVLWPYPLVRREWWMEPESWCHQDEALFRVLIAEARDGLWGTAIHPMSNP